MILIISKFLLPDECGLHCQDCFLLAIFDDIVPSKRRDIWTVFVL